MSVRRRFTSAILQFIGLLTVIGLLAALVALPLLPRILQVEDEITKADYIVPLAGDWHRLIRAAEVFRSGAAPQILLSNSRVRPPGRLQQIREDMGLPNKNPREFRTQLMRHLGVPEDAMSTFGDGHISTAEEAEALRDHLAAKRAAGKVRIILVTSPYHTRRARLVFSDAMPDVHFSVTSPPEGKLESRWWRDRDSAVRSVLESFKFAHYLVGGRFRAHSSTP